MLLRPFWNDVLEMSSSDSSTIVENSVGTNSLTAELTSRAITYSSFGRRFRFDQKGARKEVSNITEAVFPYWRLGPKNERFNALARGRGSTNDKPRSCLVGVSRTFVQDGKERKI